VHPRTRSSASGLTLIELVVALAVLAIVAGGAAITWLDVAAALRLEAGIHQLAADLHDARVVAVAAQARTRLAFVRGQTSYRIERADDEGAFDLTLQRPLPEGLRIADVNSGGDLVFSARGNAENGTVVLVDARGLRASLRVNQRGRVTIDRGRT
jgi:prepilin-type N-terminal cleavage/methylation domain-containing protein